MSFQFRPFSRKQQMALHWWEKGSGHERCRMMLADGAIRSGKTVAMILSFLRWSLKTYRGQCFILAGVTSGALRRNVLEPMLSMLETLGIPYVWKRAEAAVLIGGNTYYLFGADKDNAQDRLQGLTAAGAFADEAALFPRSFVDQMIGRCSVEGSRIFLNCNPNGAYHYIKTDFIDRAEEIGLYRLHFTMEDNLTLSPAIRESYARSFTGVFYRQYILGEWVSAEGAVYPMWDDTENTYDETGPEMYEGMRRFCAVDYGTVNPCVFLDARDDGHTYRIAKEYYWDSVEMKNRGYRVLNAVNEVREGIAVTGVLIGSRQVLAERSRCPQLLREMHSYVWDDRARLRGEEKPLKERDHAMDALRYLCHTKTDRFRLP